MRKVKLAGILGGGIIETDIYSVSRMEIAQYYDLVIVSINISFHISVNCNDVGGQRLVSQHFFSGQKTDWTGLVYDAPTIC